MSLRLLHGLLFFLIFSTEVGRAMDKSYRDVLTKNLEEVTQNFLKYNELTQLERHPKFDFPKFSNTELDNFLKAEFGGAYDGHNELIHEYVRFFASRPVAQLQLWFTLDQHFFKELDGKPHASLTYQLLRSRINYPNYHDNESLLLPYPISLVYGNVKSAFVDQRWDSKLHFKLYSAYLSDLFKTMNRTSHALAASVLGAATITRLADFQQKSYWELYPFIDHSSRDFYPAMLAAAFVFHQFEKSGLKRHAFKTKEEWVQVTSVFPLHLEVLGIELKDKEKKLASRNPNYFKRIVPANSFFILPKSGVDKFRAQEVEIAKESAYRIHKIKTPFALVQYTPKSNESMSILSKNFNSRVLDVVNINGLGDSLTLQKRTLFIKVPIKDSAFYAGFDTVSLDEIQEQIKLRKEQFVGWPEQHKPKPAESNSQQIHVVKSGDTLGAIGRKYNVSVNQLMQWNNLKSTNLQIGQKLVIKK